MVVTRHGSQIAALLPVEAGHLWATSTSADVGIRDARARFAEIVAEARELGTFVTRKGKRVALITAPEAAAAWDAHTRTRAAVEDKYASVDEGSDRLTPRQETGELVALCYARSKPWRPGEPWGAPEWRKAATLMDLCWANLSREQMARLLADHQGRLLEVAGRRWSTRQSWSGRLYGSHIGDIFVDQLNHHRLGITRRAGAVVATMDHRGRVRFANPAYGAYDLGDNPGFVAYELDTYDLDD